MKKFVIITLFLYISKILFSQVNTGISLGSNFSTFTGDSINLPFSNMKPGVYAGIFWDINSGYQSFIQIGGFYSQQGAIYKDEYFNFGNKYSYVKRLNIDYIQIPISWKQVWGDWYTVLGFYGEIVAISKTKWIETIEYADTIIVSTGTYQSFTNELRMYDAGIKLSLGIQIPISSRHDFIFSASYNHGFFSAISNPNRIENRMYNRYFTVSMGIIINSNTYKYKSRR